MKKYNSMGITVLILFLLITAGFNLLLTVFSNYNSDKYYNIEVNRAYRTITLDGNYTAPDLSDYEYIRSVDYLEADASSKITTLFFQEENRFIIYPVYQNETLTGYVKFNLSTNENVYARNVRITVNILLAVILLFLTIGFLYLKKQILAPFQTITELPLALSKGTLTAPTPETPSRYFGSFIWRLNMLRETLETHKKNELKLQKEKKILILSISHDIKTPLSAIHLYTKALREHLYAGEGKRIELLNRIDKQGREIEEFVNDIVKASKEDFLDIRVMPGEIYLSDLMNRLHDYYDEKLALIKTEFIIEVTENPLLYGDPDRTVEVMQNIIENAVKYGDGKSIWITSALEEDCRLITVANTGCTLPANEIVHIFDSFFRGSNTGNQSGSGLGLYICRQILKQMDGEIYAEVKDHNMYVTVVLKQV